MLGKKVKNTNIRMITWEIKQNISNTDGKTLGRKEKNFNTCMTEKELITNHQLLIYEINSKANSTIDRLQSCRK
jgi:hypothetical protein